MYILISIPLTLCVAPSQPESPCTNTAYMSVPRGYCIGSPWQLRLRHTSYSKMRRTSWWGSPASFPGLNRYHDAERPETNDSLKADPQLRQRDLVFLSLFHACERSFWPSARGVRPQLRSSPQPSKPLRSSPALQFIHSGTKVHVVLRRLLARKPVDITWTLRETYRYHKTSGAPSSQILLLKNKSWAYRSSAP